MACCPGEEVRTRASFHFLWSRMQPGAFSEYLGSNTDGGQSQKDPRPPQKSSSLENIYEIHFQGQERDRDPNLLFFFFF